MADIPQVLRLSKVAKEFNIGLQTIVDFLSIKGYHIELNLNARITTDMYEMLVKEFSIEKNVKEESRRSGISFVNKETVTVEDPKPVVKENENFTEDLLIKDVQSVAARKKEIFKIEKAEAEIKQPKVLGKIDPEKLKQKSNTPKEKVSEK